MVAVLLLIDVIILVTWQIVDPLTSKVENLTLQVKSKLLIKLWNFEPKGKESFHSPLLRDLFQRAPMLPKPEMTCESRGNLKNIFAYSPSSKHPQSLHYISPRSLRVKVKGNKDMWPGWRKPLQFQKPKLKLLPTFADARLIKVLYFWKI